MLHHVQNEHEWALSYGRMGPGACSHGELTDDRDKDWIEKGSPAHSALTKIGLDKRFLNNVHYYLNFRYTCKCMQNWTVFLSSMIFCFSILNIILFCLRSTANLEIFNNHILMYASKRIAYSPPVYRARNILAALDYNYSVDLPLLTKDDGSPM